jgi:hypothetical protein
MNKRRGRKPKGGKIIEGVSNTDDVVVAETNVILHLQCKQEDICKQDLQNDIEPFGFEKEVHSLINKPFETTNRDLGWKVRKLAIDLQSNRVSSGQSACFWCTCEFDVPAIYIPKHKVGETYNCYGCFCSPECATAHLFKENIEQSTKFERFAMLNHIYRTLFEYESNICPAPDPHYTLDKFYGNLTVDEYRQTFRRERQLVVIDKPLSRCLPELYEENAIEPLQTFGIKMRKRDTKSKSDIMNENFMGGVK